MEIILLFGIVIFGFGFILSIGALLYYYYDRVANFIKQIKKVVLNKRGLKNKTKKINITNSNLLTMRMYICRYLKKPKTLVYVAGITLFLTLLLITKSSVFSEGVKYIANCIIAVTYITGMVIFTIKMAKDNSVFSKINSFGVLILYVITFALIPVIVFSKSGISPEKSAISFLMFFSMAFFSVFVAIKYYYKKMALLVALTIYFLILIVGAIAFGEFYYNNYPIKFNELILQFDNTNDFWIQLIVLIKIGIRYFFEFPSQDILCKLSLFQFMVGKLLELGVLGYVASQFVNVKNAYDSNTSLK